MSHCIFNTQWDKNYAEGADDRSGWGFPGQKTFSHPQKAFNQHLILHPAVQSKCQGFGEEIWSSFESLQTHSKGKGGCDFSPYSSAGKRDKMSLGRQWGYLFWQGHLMRKTTVCTMLNANLFPLTTLCLKGNVNTFGFYGKISIAR